ncbi:MAG: right-handed parallel beta-helix repeat-containing protein [Candidatus Lokiarchaeota archaeon]|nr:right-handed parallel beta-helix repeat-containing protein [Candidatus Lokiarchaeota archaeon]
MLITRNQPGTHRLGSDERQIRASPAHDPISITSDAEMLAFTNKTGDGSSGNPFIIQNLQIDGGDDLSCIEIKNVNSYHVTIQNCTLTNSGSLLGDKDSGIELFNSQNIKIRNCTISNNLVGIWAIYSSAITIEDNHIHHNLYHGIWLENTGSTTIKNNVIESNTRHGIFLEESGSNTISSNTCMSNGLRGIYIDSDSFENEAFLNQLGLNVVAQAWDDGVGNVWDTPIGNKYGDYEARYPSAENDGILWDTPYEIFGFAGAVDTRPVFDVGGTHGTINITGNAGMDAFCGNGGNGTDGLSPATAHRISDFKVSADGGDYCIKIKDVDRYVIIENCTFITAYFDEWTSAGVKLENCTNIRLTNCTSRYNTGGVRVNSGCQRCRFDDNILTHNSYIGIYITASSNLTIFNNTVRKNYVNGVHLWSYCEDNNISSNHIMDNSINGIILQDEKNTTVEGNWLVNNYLGSQILYSENLTIKENHVINSTYLGISVIGSPGGIVLESNQVVGTGFVGISLQTSTGVAMASNNMTNASVMVEGSLGEIASFTIDSTNKVNGKPLYYYHDQNGLNAANFTNAGQIIVVNCNSSLISNINCSSASNGIILYYCKNVTISNSTLDDFTSAGLLIKASTNCTVSGTTMRGCHEGVLIENSTEIRLASNTFIDGGLVLNEDVAQCETLDISTSNTVNGRTLRYYVSRTGLVEANFTNAGQIILINCSNSRVYGQNVSYSSIGIYAYLCNDTSIASIGGRGNSVTGIYVNASRNATVENSDVSDCNWGISFQHSTACTLSASTADRCFWGVFINYCNDSIVASNSMVDCIEAGACLWASNNLTFEDNTVRGSDLYGLHMNLIWHSRLVANDISYNKEAGIMCYNGKWMTIAGNLFSDNGYGMILSQNMSHNRLYCNSFFNNPKSNGFYDEQYFGTNNTWSNGTFGNYWDDYSSRHPNATVLAGIWSQPYVLNGSTTDADPQPLAYPWLFYRVGEDPDGDGIPNEMEIFVHGSDPTKLDTDGDGMDDGYETRNGLSPLVDDASGDLDNDGLSNLQEYLLRTRADNPDTDGDGFSDKVELDWGTDPRSAYSSPLFIILIVVAAIAASVVLFVKVVQKTKIFKSKKVTYGRGVDTWLEEELEEGSQAITEKIDEKRAILSRVMEPMTTEEKSASVPTKVLGKPSVGGKKKGAGQEEVVKHEVDAQTEGEVDVFKKKEFCIVCNTSLKATTFICPHCETKYCIRCAIALSERKESCWVCKNPMNFNP